MDLLKSNFKKSTQMDYHSMTLPELKQAAKNHTPKIKQYYIKKKHELIELLTMEQLPDIYIIEKKKRSELIKEAQSKGYDRLWNLKKCELIEILYPSTNQNYKNDNHAKKHDNPEHSKGK
jgi:hypothetical protein